MNSPTDTENSMVAELTIVERILFDALENLQRPLADLVRGQIGESKPYIHAAFVIATAWSNTSPEREAQRRQWLAAALEMLYVALRIHGSLVAQSMYNVDKDESQRAARWDKSFVGSTILAGDYCFSKAAQMAAKTDNPIVVRIFAQALQTISEGQVRALFSNAPHSHDDTQTLLQFGISAALELAALSDSDRTKVWDVGNALANFFSGFDAMPQMHPPPTHIITQADLPSAQAAAWISILQWLAPDLDNRTLSRA